MLCVQSPAADNSCMCEDFKQVYYSFSRPGRRIVHMRTDDDKQMKRVRLQSSLPVGHGNAYVRALMFFLLIAHRSNINNEIC